MRKRQVNKITGPVPRSTLIKIDVRIKNKKNNPEAFFSFFYVQALPVGIENSQFSSI